MVEREGGQWNVAVKDDAVYLERVSEDNDRLFESLLEPEEARALAELLAKHADKVPVTESNEDTDESDDSEDSDDSDDDTGEAEKSGDSEDSD
jgi:hypothetical protein